MYGAKKRFGEGSSHDRRTRETVTSGLVGIAGLALQISLESAHRLIDARLASQKALAPVAHDAELLGSRLIVIAHRQATQGGELHLEVVVAEVGRRERQLSVGVWGSRFGHTEHVS